MWLLPSAKTPLSLVLFIFEVLWPSWSLERVCSSWVRAAVKFQKELSLGLINDCFRLQHWHKSCWKPIFVVYSGAWFMNVALLRATWWGVLLSLVGQLLSLKLLSFLVLGMNCESWVVTAFVSWGRSCRAVSLQISLDAAGLGFLGFSVGLSCILLTDLVIYRGLQWAFGSESALGICISPFPLCFTPLIHLPVAVESRLINKTSLIDWQVTVCSQEIKSGTAKQGGYEGITSVGCAVIPLELEFHQLNRVRICKYISGCSSRGSFGKCCLFQMYF